MFGVRYLCCQEMRQVLTHESVEIVEPAEEIPCFCDIMYACEAWQRRSAPPWSAATLSEDLLLQSVISLVGSRLLGIQTGQRYHGGSLNASSQCS
eukprot:1883697-Amphidinium_carterae.3